MLNPTSPGGPGRSPAHGDPDEQHQIKASRLDRACWRRFRGGVRLACHAVVELRLSVVPVLEVLQIVRRDHVPPPGLIGENYFSRDVDVPFFLHRWRGISAEHTNLRRQAEQVCRFLKGASPR